jgi:hypothetical protein
VDTETQDSISERKRAITETGKQLEPKLPGFWGRIILLFQGGRLQMTEVDETDKEMVQ